MLPRLSLIALPAAALLLTGCISTAVGVVTAPVRAAAQVADWTTTSQSESDRNRGRAMREREERLGRLMRQRDDALDDCRDNRPRRCADAERLAGEIAQLNSAANPR
jgi:hypothetical protein